MIKAVALRDEIVITPKSGTRWSDEEKYILDTYYPKGGIQGVLDAFVRIGIERSPDAVARMARSRKLRTEKRRPRTRARNNPVMLTRPITSDTVEIVTWFFQRGFSPTSIAKELNRTTADVTKILKQESYI